MSRTEIIGDVAVIEKIESFPANSREKLRIVLTKLAIGLQGYIMSQKLSGQVLHNRTGNLRNNIKWEVKSDGDSVIAYVGVGVNASSYGRAHEYGFHGVVTVKEHMRTIKQAWGRPLAAPKTVTVRAHEMHMNLPERSFLRSALADKSSYIRKQMIGAIE